LKKKVLVVLGGGGHTTQMLKLVDLLGDSFEYEYLVGFNETLSEKKIKTKGKVYKIHKPRQYQDNKIVAALKSVRTFLEALNVMRKSNAEAIVSAGAGVAAIASIAAKIFRKKVIGLEDWSRQKKPSTAGRLTYFVSDLFFVQWPEMKKHYPKSVYAGRLA
jgi:UDP-N-acetylglucosamine:LPS N-acetylglucosamine transferase